MKHILPDYGLKNETYSTRITGNGKSTIFAAPKLMSDFWEGINIETSKKLFLTTLPNNPV